MKRWLPWVLALTAASAPARAADSDGDGITDDADVYPCDPALAGAAYVPAQGQHAGLLFEDQWPSRGDGDFNDVVLTYNYVLRTDPAGDVVEVLATFNLLALGGTYDNGLGLHLPIPASSVASITRRTAQGSAALAPRIADGEATITVVDDLRALFGGQAGPLNAVSGPALGAQTVELSVRLATPAPASLVAQAPFDLFIFHVFAPAHEIHRPAYGGTARMDTTLFGTQDDGSAPGRAFVDTQGLPFALELPVFDAWPAEGQDIAWLFPDIIGFATSGGATNADFYVSVVDPAFAFAGSPAPQPSLLTGYDFVDITCGPPNGESLFQVLRTFGPVLTDGDHTFTVGGQTLPVELVTYAGPTTFSGAHNLGNGTPDARTLIVRVQGNLTVAAGAALTAATRKRGMVLYVEGDARIDGTISMSARGAKAAGQNVFLARDSGGNLLYVPAVGGGGAARVTAAGANKNGLAGAASGLGSGGGGSGGAHGNSCTVSSGAGAAGTSWSGGAGGGGGSRLGSNGSAGNGAANGGAGGGGTAAQATPWGKAGGGGAGNAGGAAAASGAASASAGGTGTGGLLVLFATGAVTVNGSLEAKGSNGGATSTGYYVWSAGGGASGGGSVHVFYGTTYSGAGSLSAAGGTGGRGYCGHTTMAYCLYGGNGGSGATRTAQLDLGN
jgi:LruC domain-containing protein